MFLALFAIAAMPPNPPRIEPVRAQVRLLESTVASERAWAPATNARQHERIERLPDGRQVRLRITDHE